MSGKIVLFILVSSLLSTLLISAASSLCISYGESPENFNTQFNSSTTYINVPFHYQRTNYYCGPAALEMVFDYYGEDIPQAEIADVARTYRSGTYRDELRRAAHFSNLSTSLGDEMSGNITGYSARKIGYAAFEQHGLTIDDLKTLINKEEPVIVSMWYSPRKVYGHYRLVIGYNRTHMIMHDPLHFNKSMTYSTFLDLWERSGNWGLWVRPWNIELQMPSTVVKEEDFEVTANITYPCSTPFDIGEYPASSCKATIVLQEGLELASGETAQHSLGNLTAGNSIQTSWPIHASETGFYNISAIIMGIVEGSVGSYSYEDAIGGSCTNSLAIINTTYRVHNIHTGLYYTTIQTAINAPETLDGHTILVDAGTYYEHVVVNKSVSLVGEDSDMTIIDGNLTGKVVNVTSDNVTVTGLTVQRSGSIYWESAGIFLDNVENCSITANIITENPFAGIDLSNSNYCTVSGNSISDNSGVGATIVSGSFNVLSGNNITRNGWSSLTLNDYACNNIISKNNISNNNLAVEGGHSINLYRSSNNMIFENSIAGDPNGIRLEYGSNNNTIFENSIIDNTEVGVTVESWSDNNTISGNRITGNSEGIAFGNNANYNTVVKNIISGNDAGIFIEYSIANTIYHNSFFNNTHNVNISDGSTNTWDDSYPSGGNHWSNYTGVDSDHDGIGDTIHVMDENNQDNYPLMGTFSDFNATSEYNVQSICNSTITDLEFNGTAICFKVTGKDGTTGFCRTCIPTVLMNDTYQVFVNGTQVSHTLLPCSNSTHSYLYFIYSHSTQEVIVVPEFPSFLILPLFMTATLLAVIFYRRKSFHVVKPVQKP